MTLDCESFITVLVWSIFSFT